MKNFILIGAAGFIAPRHMNAILQTKNDLVAAIDNSDSVGVLDKYFPNSHFYTDFDALQNYINDIKSQRVVDFTSICTPNYLHFDHVKFALSIGSNAICEKPVVIEPSQIDELESLESISGNRVFHIAQLRLHPSTITLINKFQTNSKRSVSDVLITYITPRGHWYETSWKGASIKSGGLAINAGFHLFDLLIYLFGNVQKSELHLATNQKASGYLELEWARVQWYLSVDANDLPKSHRNNQASFRVLNIDGEDIDLSPGFEDLHTKSYEEILSGNGFRVSDAKPAVALTSGIRTSGLSITEKIHPLLQK